VSRKNTIVARRTVEGGAVEVLSDGATRALPDRTDWDRLRAMTDEEVEAAAEGDPDNPPLTEASLRRMRRVPQVKTMRRAIGLTQEEFAERYQIPLGTLRDWEQGRSTPDQPARAYLKVIALDPDGIGRLLKAG
jgi:putative transcriptional regulator